jgi:hypothetical protein
MDGLIKFLVEAKKASYATQGDTVANAASAGTLKKFNGHEIISHSQSSLYELFYAGGTVR